MNILYDLIIKYKNQKVKRMRDIELNGSTRLLGYDTLNSFERKDK